MSHQQHIPDMIPERPARDVYDDHYQISPHFKKTPGLTAIPQSSPNYNINRRLKRKMGALYGKYGFERCPNYGLFWAGWPQWTMIPDRDKMVVLVVEMKERDIEFWYKMDEEARQILREAGFADPGLNERGVSVRYYEFWEDREEQESEEREAAEQIRRREREAAEQNSTRELTTPMDLDRPARLGSASFAQLEETASIPSFHGLLARGQLREPGRSRTASIPSLTEILFPRRSSPTQGVLRQQFEARVEDPSPAPTTTPVESFRILDDLGFPLNVNRTSRRTGPEINGTGSAPPTNAHPL